MLSLEAKNKKLQTIFVAGDNKAILRWLAMKAFVCLFY